MLVFGADIEVLLKLERLFSSKAYGVSAILATSVKRKKLCHKMHTDTSFYVTICTWRRLGEVKKSCIMRRVRKLKSRGCTPSR